MPSRDRARTAMAVVDGQLADRAAMAGRIVSPGQVRRWRMAALLPAPTSLSPRPASAPFGRAALRYEEEQLAVLDEIVAALADHARPGRAPEALALILFGHRLPVDGDLVRSAVDGHLRRLRDEIREVVALATRQFPPPTDVGLLQSGGFEQAEALAKLATSRSGIATAVRRNLRAGGRPATKKDVSSALTSLFAVVVGHSEPARGGGETDDDVLHAVGSHGMVEPVTDGGPVLIPEGPSFFIEGVRLVAELAMREHAPPASISDLESARDLLCEVARALDAIPDPRVRHHLGGDPIAALWDPSDPSRIALLVNTLVLLQRSLGVALDASLLIDAVRTQGWLDDDSPEMRDSLTQVEILDPGLQLGGTRKR